eukprot:4886898-Prymnesium_polylepis.2
MSGLAIAVIGGAGYAGTGMMAFGSMAGPRVSVHSAGSKRAGSVSCSKRASGGQPSRDAPGRWGVGLRISVLDHPSKHAHNETTWLHRTLFEQNNISGKSNLPTPQHSHTI